MTRKVHRHSQTNNTVGSKLTQTLRARHHPRAHPVRDLPQEISNTPSGAGTALLSTVYDMIYYKEPHPKLSDTKPGTDFYTYVNGSWLKRTAIPSYISSYGVSEEVESILQGILYRDVEACRRLAEIGREQKTLSGKLCDAVGRLAMSVMRPHVQQNNVEYLKRGLRSLGCLRESADISRSLGSMARYNIKSLLELSIIPGEDGYVLSVGAGELGLPAASYYVPSVAVNQGNDTVHSYTKLIQRACKELDHDDISSAVAFEASLAPSIYQANMHSESGLSLDTIQTRWPAIQWKDLVEAYGIPQPQLNHLRIYVDCVEWLDILNRLIRETPLESWYSVFALHILLHALPYLPPPYDDLHYIFFGKEMRGQKEKIPQKFLMLNIVKQQLSVALGYLFIKRHMTATMKRKATEFTQTIVRSAIRRMETIEWMSPAARRAAADKLRNMKLSVAWSEPLISSPPTLPSLQTDTLLANLYLLEAATTDRKLRWLQTPPRKDEWEESPYSVNAYYYHDTNELVIPIGSFMWPFMDLTGQNKRGVGWNFGGLGAVIGHEITHAFDREGKEFDPSGRAKCWWPKAVQEAYQAKTKDLIRLFSEAKLMGRPVNGALTLDENLADLGGLGIALDALHHALEGASKDEKREQIRQFFLAYAVSWRTKEQPERRLQRLILDKHAPIELRVNLIVSQFEEWYEAFHVQTGDKLYVPPEERIRIF